MHLRSGDLDGNFRGFGIGDLVRPREGIIFLSWHGTGLVIERSLNALMLGEGDGEHYDPILVIVAGGKRHHVHVDDVEKVGKDDT
jgi:hypothetical protein